MKKINAMLSAIIICGTIACKNKKEAPGADSGVDSPAVVLEGNLKTQKLDATKKYVIKGPIFVQSGRKLTIPAGTVLMGEKSTRGALAHEMTPDTTPPVVTAGQSFNYAENQSAAAVVGAVAATDAVGVTGFRFSATSTATSADGCCTIAPDGKIALTAAGVAAGVAQNDFETSPNTFTYGIQARDAAGNWSSAAKVTLNVTDVDETVPAR